MLLLGAFCRRIISAVSIVAPARHAILRLCNSICAHNVCVPGSFSQTQSFPPYSFRKRKCSFIKSVEPLKIGLLSERCILHSDKISTTWTILCSFATMDQPPKRCIYFPFKVGQRGIIVFYLLFIWKTLEHNILKWNMFWTLRLSLPKVLNTPQDNENYK